MIAALFARFIAPFATPLLIAGLIATASYAAWTRIELAWVRNQVEGLQEDVGAMRAKISTKDGVIDRQAAAIKEMKAAGEAQADRVARAAADARKARQESDRRVRELLAKSRVPSECRAATDWAAAQAKEIAKDWNR